MNPIAKLEIKLGAARLVVSAPAYQDDIVEPDRKLEGICIAGEGPALVELVEAVFDVIHGVITPMRLAVILQQSLVNVGAVVDGVIDQVALPE